MPHQRLNRWLHQHATWVGAMPAKYGQRPSLLKKKRGWWILSQFSKSSKLGITIHFRLCAHKDEIYTVTWVDRQADDQRLRIWPNSWFRSFFCSFRSHPNSKCWFVFAYQLSTLIPTQQHRWSNVLLGRKMTNDGVMCDVKDRETTLGVWQAQWSASNVRAKNIGNEKK